MRLNLKLTSVAYHRNGVAGEGFHVVLFKMKQGRAWTDMVGVLFSQKGRCSVLDVNETLKGNIGFANGNSWRGDDFEDQLRAWAGAWDERPSAEMSCA